MVLVVVVGSVLGFVWSVFDDTADAPEPEPGKPELKTATAYITGDDGGPFGVSYTVWTPDGDVGKRMRENGVIESDPTAYSVDLSGFESDGNEFFLGTEDISVEARKTKSWEGDLTILLEVNNKIVACDTMSEVASTESYLRASISFDADEPEHYEGDFVCRLYMWFY